MNIARIILAALGAFTAYFILGGLSLVVIPAFRTEFLKYPAVYRSQEGVRNVMPAGMVAMFVAMLILAVIYSMLCEAEPGPVGGARFGVLIGLFVVCAFVIHNYVNLNIGIKLALEQAIVYFFEWTIAGLVIGVIYRPISPS